jgi:hypothetical protein
LRLLGTSTPAMKVWDSLGPGEDGFQIIDGRTWNVGAAPFDAHPWWHIDSADASYDEADAPWTVTFELFDRDGILETSAPVTVSFVPEPAGAMLLIAAMLLARRPRTNQGN